MIEANSSQRSDRGVAPGADLGDLSVDAREVHDNVTTEPVIKPRDRWDEQALRGDDPPHLNVGDVVVH